MMLGMIPTPKVRNMENTKRWQHVHEDRLKLLPEGWEFCENEEAQMWLKIMDLSENDRYKEGELCTSRPYSPYDVLYLPVKVKTNNMKKDFVPHKESLEKPKQETLEEAVERLSKNAYKKHSVKDDKLSLDEQIQRSGGFIVGFKEGMIEGAKWMQEKMYIEAIEFAEWIRIKDFQTTERNNWIGLNLRYYTTEELFEQFKKKS